MPVIRHAGVKDVHVIRDLAYVIWHHAYSNILSSEQLAYMLELIYSREALETQLVTLKHEFILVLENDDPVGFASFSLKEKTSATYRLHKIYVLPKEQGRGTGKFLLEYIINTARLAGATSLELNVNRHNSAKSFYEKQGFVIEKEEDIDIGNGFFMNDFVMRLNF